MRLIHGLSAVTIALLATTSAQAREWATVQRIDDQTVELTREDASPVAVWLSLDTRLDKHDTLAVPRATTRTVRLSLPASSREFVILRRGGGKATVVAERQLPLQHASNFRDIGGYVTKDGHTVRWGKAFRSGAMPLLTEADYGLIGQLGIGTVVDFRSLEERSLTDDKVDDRTGALFVSNDYSLRTLMSGTMQGNGENTYKGMEQLLIPQYRALYRRLIANDGAVLYHCSAGQDRTGIATALLYDMLGVDRETILKDYHLSTALRRTQWEMPPFDPKTQADNPLVRYLASRPASEQGKAEPLYSRSGVSHLTQFFAYLDQTYGGSEGYMHKALGLSDAELAKLRQVMLD